MEIPLIQDLVIVLGLAVFVILLFLRFKLPTIVGFLITGTIAGPHGLSLIKASEEVHIIAEIGVILLLFIIGLEFSLKSLASIKKAVLVGGSIQVMVVVALVAAGAMLTGFSYGEAVFLGFLFSLSSTAIVLKLLQERGEIGSPHGRTTLAILIFQDIIVVPMMLVTPMLAGGSQNVFEQVVMLLFKGAFVIVFMLISARVAVPKLLFWVANTRSKELFVLCILVICFAVAWLTSSMGLSLALGAFMAGLIISESEYSHQATSNILPFREVFTSFFFISIGMLLDLQFLVSNALLIAGLTLATVVLKVGVASFAGVMLGYPIRTALLLGLAIFQVGEFSFILSGTGLEHNLLSPEVYQYFLSVSILTMVLTPFLIANASHIVKTLLRLPFPMRWRNRPIRQHTGAFSELEKLEDHLIIIGFGINGRNLAQAAREANIPYVIIELNPNTVRTERRKGERIVFGDAVHPHMLSHVQVQKARVAVVAISDPVATTLVVASIRQQSLQTHIIVRTRMVQEIEENYQAGANEVIPEEFETSIEIFTRVLNRYLVPEDKIESFIQKIRADNYEMLRSMPISHGYGSSLALDLASINIAALTVQQEGNTIIGRKLADADLRNQFGVTVLAIKRGTDLITYLTGDTEILQDDVLYVLGEPEKVATFHKLIKL